MNEEINYESGMDLMSLFKALLNKWWLILLCVFVGVGASSLYSFFTLEDVYTSRSSMIVQVESQTDYGYSELMTGERLVNTYSAIAESARVLEELSDNLNLDYSNQQLDSMIYVAGVENTLIVELSVTHTDPVLAKSIAAEVVSIVENIAFEYDGLEKIEVLDIASTPVSPSGPNRPLYSIIGVLLGGIVGAGIILTKEFLDNNIKKPQDVETYLGIRLLGKISNYDMNQEGLRDAKTTYNS